jgi:DNA-binding transcriptional LysR family regulator
MRITCPFHIWIQIEVCINFLDVLVSQVYVFEKRMFVTFDIKDCDMARNLDLTALRSFVAVVDTGGVTRAAAQLHMTQSAVSMQLKRLEEGLGQNLLDRSNRSMTLTAQGELLLSYGRRLLAMNDEVWARMTDRKFEGEVVFGVPHDVVYPHIPRVLKRFAAAYPRVKVSLVSSFTSELKAMLAAGDCDVILTTETGRDEGAVCLTELELVWYGAPEGTAWKERPLRVASEKQCIFRPISLKALDDAGIAWEMGVDTTSSMTVEASLSADLAVHARLKGTGAQYLEEIDHGGTLPELPKFQVNMMIAPASQSEMAGSLAEMVREAYCCAPAKSAKLLAVV